MAGRNNEQPSAPADRTARRATILGFALGGGVAGCACALERVLHHGYLYRGPGDALSHVSLAFLVGLAVGTAIGLPAAGFVSAAARRPEPSRTRFIARILGAIGFAAGASCYVFILAPSKLGRSMDPVLGTLVMAGVLAAASWIATPMLVTVLSRRRAWVALGLSIIGVLLAWIDLHSYVRSYGNVHVVAAIVIWCLSGAACALLLHTAAQRAQRVTLGMMGALTVLSIGGLATIDPAMSARVAVLELGGVEKLVIQHVLWPAFDGDADGHAARFGGPDCDDTDATVVPGRPPYRARAFGCEPIVPEKVQFSHPDRTGARAAHDLVWVLVDTWRSDTQESLPQALETFVRFEGFRSCGSRTKEVVERLLGSRSCGSDHSPGGFPRSLQSMGYAVKAFSEYKIGADLFPELHLADAPKEVVNRAGEWIAERTAQQQRYFAYVHFKGGHAPYAGSGSTPRERYEASITATLEHVRSLLASIRGNPVILIMGDHGEEFFEHEGTAHAVSLYEEVLETPVYLRAPGWTSRVQQGNLSCEDLMTVIWRALEGHPYRFQPSRYMFATLDSPRGVHGGISHTVMHALRFDESWKVIWKPNVAIWELYDLRSDPGERNNLADSEPERLRRAASLLTGALEACDPALAETRGLQAQRKEPISLE